MPSNFRGTGRGGEARLAGGVFPGEGARPGAPGSGPFLRPFGQQVGLTRSSPLEGEPLTGQQNWWGPTTIGDSRYTRVEPGTGDDGRVMAVLRGTPEILIAGSLGVVGEIHMMYGSLAHKNGSPAAGW